MPGAFGRLPLWAIGLLAAYAGTYLLTRAHTTAESGYLQFYLMETARDGLLGGLVLCLILFCARSAVRGDKAKPLILHALESPPARALGLFSYSLYLTHCIVLQALLALIGHWDLIPLTALALKTFVGLPAAIVFALLFYKIFEKPFLAPLQKAVVNSPNPPVLR